MNLSHRKGECPVISFSRSISVIDAHTEGEPVRVVVSGLPRIQGSTMIDKMNWFETHLSGARELLTREPRGHRDMYVTVLTPPVTEDGDAGVLYMHTTGQATMCGHGTIGVVTVLLETGIVAAPDGSAVVRIDAPAGRVTAGARVKDGRVEEVSFQNVPSFLYEDGLKVKVPGAGEVEAAVAFGGDFYIFVRAADLGLRVAPECSRELAGYAMWLKDWGNRELNVVHPTNPDIRGIYGVIVTDGAEKTPSGWKSRETCIFADSAVDRSPCGTGTSARMALLYGRGQMEPGQMIENSSILNTTFRGSIDGEVQVGGFRGIVPRIAGRAWITGFNDLVLDPRDPFQHGFLI